MHVLRNKMFIVAIALTSISGCKKEGTVGPCEHTYKDPVIHIESVRDRQSNQQIQTFKVLQAVRDGNKEHPYFLKIVSYNVVTDDTALVCNSPCGFGTSEGTYALKVSASGYRDTTVVVTARYAVFNGGCPSSNSGGTSFSFQMQRQ